MLIRIRYRLLFSYTALAILFGQVSRHLAAAPLPADSDRPLDVVVLMIDDLRPDGISALGNPIVKTPNLDALVQRGFSFQNAYTMGSYRPAVCLPSRHQFLTGKSLFSLDDAKAHREADGCTLPAVFKSAGYYTAHAGKRNNSPRAIHKQFDIWPAAEQDFYTARQNADVLIEVVEKQPSDRPLLLYMAGREPHDPQVAEPEFYAMYQAADLPLPPRFRALHPFDNGEMTARDEVTLPFPRTSHDVREKLARYYASTTYLDAQIGRLIAALKAAGRYESTLFVVLGDNGLSLGDHGLLGKQNLYEYGGMHIPLAFAGPGISQGSSAALTYIFDVFPTLCELAGQEIPEECDGQSLVPIIAGRKAKVRDQILTAYKETQRAVRDERWKLIRYPQVDQTQLFDLTNDPLELSNLANLPEQAGKVEEMLAQLRSLQQKFHDSAPLVVEDPRPAAWSPDEPSVRRAIEEERARDAARAHRREE